MLEATDDGYKVPKGRLSVCLYARPCIIWDIRVLQCANNVVELLIAATLPKKVYLSGLCLFPRGHETNETVGAPVKLGAIFCFAKRAVHVQATLQILPLD
jgi:hypothetical protein